MSVNDHLESDAFFQGLSGDHHMHVPGVHTNTVLIVCTIRTAIDGLVMWSVICYIMVGNRACRPISILSMSHTFFIAISTTQSYAKLNYAFVNSDPYRKYPCMLHNIVTKIKLPCIGGVELVSLSGNRVFISAESKGRGGCKIAIATKWYQFHTTDKCGFFLCRE